MATAAEEFNTVLKNPERCALCTSDFVHPVIICACMHVFCKSCLQRDVARQLAKPKSIKASGVTCPTCQCHFRLPQGGVAELPKADFVVRQETAANPSQTPDCEFCVDEDKATATRCCELCDMSLCTACCDRIHSRQRKMASHSPRDISSSRGEQMRLSVCCSHPTQIESYWCCDAPACPECVISKHHGHTPRSINEGRDHLQTELANHTIRLDEQRKCLKKTRTEIVKSRNIVVHRLDQSLSHIDHMTNRTNQLRLYGSISELGNAVDAIKTTDVTRAASDESCKDARDLLVNHVVPRNLAKHLLETVERDDDLYIPSITVLNGDWYRKALVYTYADDATSLSHPGPVIHAASPEDRKDYCMCTYDVAESLGKVFGVLPQQPPPGWYCGDVLDEDIFILSEAEVESCEDLEDTAALEYTPTVYNASGCFDDWYELRSPSGARLCSGSSSQTCVSDLFQQHDFSDYADIVVVDL